MSIKNIFKIVFLLCSLALSGCGSSSKEAYKIAMDPSWYPLNFKGREKNVVGFSTDLLRAISAEVKKEMILETTNWDTLFEGLKQKKYNAILSSLYPYSFNLATYSISNLYLSIGPVLVVPINSSITSLNKLSNKEVGFITGQASSVFILEEYPQILMRSYDSAPALLNALLNSDIDGALLDILLAEAYLQDLYMGKLKIATAPLNDQGLRLVALKGEDDNLIAAFNKGLMELKKNGAYQKLLEKWNLSGAAPL